MNMQKCSTSDLLSVLVDKRMASSLAKVPLSVLFELRANRQIVSENIPPYASSPIISAAKELITRALKEEISINPIHFGDPKAVKNYLRLALGGRQQEVFMVLFMDSQNRLIASDELFHGTLTQTSV